MNGILAQTQLPMQTFQQLRQSLCIAAAVSGFAPSAAHKRVPWPTPLQWQTFLAYQSFLKGVLVRADGSTAQPNNIT